MVIDWDRSTVWEQVVVHSKSYASKLMIVDGLANDWTRLQIRLCGYVIEQSIYFTFTLLKSIQLNIKLVSTDYRMGGGGWGWGKPYDGLLPHFKSKHCYVINFMTQKQE